MKHTRGTNSIEHVRKRLGLIPKSVLSMCALTYYLFPYLPAAYPVKGGNIIEPMEISIAFIFLSLLFTVPYCATGKKVLSYFPLLFSW